MKKFYVVEVDLFEVVKSFYSGATVVVKMEGY